MASRSRSHLSDGALRRSLALHLAAERGACAELLADLGEMDARRLYREDGYASMHEFCVRALGYTSGRAYKRIHVARKARRFPVMLDLVADGRLCLSGAMLLAARLTEDNARELLGEAAGRTVAEIELMLARRFPQADVPTKVEPVAAPAAASDGPVEGAPERALTDPTPAAFELSARKVEASPVPALTARIVEGSVALELSARKVERPQVVENTSVGSRAPNAAPDASSPGAAVPEPPARSAPARVKPLAPERYALQTTIDQAAHDDLRRAMDLLGRRVSRGDVAEVLKRALRLLVRDLEKRKFALTERPATRRASKPSTNPRHVPAAVKRAVYRRDGGRCTFVGDNGRRCEARGASLQYDHVLPVARGGTSTAGNLRLRCAAHNQLDAERVLGADFMRHRREAARRASESQRLKDRAPGSRSAPQIVSSARRSTSTNV